MAAMMRSRLALRQRRGKTGVLDAKATIRANQRYGGVPVEIRYRRRRLKPKLALICDVSTSMRHCAEFMLTLIYELQDQVGRARSFAFIGDMEEVSPAFEELPVQQAVEQVLTQLPPGYYSTDLGASLATFDRRFMDAVDHRTTVIFLGDGRNNYNDPRLDLMQTDPAPRQAGDLAQPRGAGHVGQRRQRHAQIRASGRSRLRGRQPGAVDLCGGSAVGVNDGQYTDQSDCRPTNT